MRIVKWVDRKGDERFSLVMRQGSVQFDSRPDWVLLMHDMDKPLRKREVQWVHPTQVQFIWVRDFSLGD